MLPPGAYSELPTASAVGVKVRRFGRAQTAEKPGRRSRRMKDFRRDTLGIIGVTVSPVNPDRVWAMVENKDKGGLYRSEDGGEKWTRVNEERKLRQRAWYYTRVYADTKDENVVYVLNVRYHKSTDGGKSFTTHNAPHGDHHDLWIDPNDSSRMIIGDDGGAQVTYDGGETWTTYHNQPTAQFYRVTTDNSFPVQTLCGAAGQFHHSHQA